MSDPHTRGSWRATWRSSSSLTSSEARRSVDSTYLAAQGGKPGGGGRGRMRKLTKLPRFDLPGAAIPGLATGRLGDGVVVARVVDKSTGLGADDLAGPVKRPTRQ